ncbi:DUF58 domain-containing protein [Salinadaptatus halalkaliphilus]|uniref:DUF58 domain-containing protein n=1 Tax=Salinadaptatus halalkaliphilus TaxID=2419781 RepID=A0A4S3TQ75_9EURY|nr:DUF58 domain-containing protein [Salinadaptatus halalkaliphilus]THE65365.1 DUF58 domain-containing protein [Salinadaptatus halalkaliphilus]
MRLTRRGWTVLATVVAALALSWQYGPRSLNAIVVPLVIVFVAGLAAVALYDRPSVERQPIDDGPVGDHRTVTVTVDTDATVAATIRDTVGDGLAAVDGEPVAETTLEGETRLRYDVALEERGERTVGPLSITVTDIFGLFRRRFDDDATSMVVVYPPVYELSGDAARAVRSQGNAAREDRDEFDHLRAYQRGDPMRDVNWKATAKRADGDLVVTEHLADAAVGSISLAGECSPAHADELTSALASIATDLLAGGIDVGVTLGDDACPPGGGSRHRRDILAMLAVSDGGDLDHDRRREADVLVRTDDDGTTVVVDDTEREFERFRDGSDPSGVAA